MNLGTREALEDARALFRFTTGHIALVVSASEALKATDLEDRGRGLGYLLAATCSTCGGVLKVGDHPAFVSEAYMLGRAALEREINAAYLSICPIGEYEGFVEHALQRSWRDLDRTVGAEGFQVRLKRNNIPSPEDVAGLPEAIERFTSNRGRPKNWTDLNVEQRVNAIHNAAPELPVRNFLIGLVGVYGKASEAMHGSFYGANQMVPEDFAFDQAAGDFKWTEMAGALAGLYHILSATTVTMLLVLESRSNSQAVSDLVGVAKQAYNRSLERQRAEPQEAVPKGDGAV